MHTFGSSRSAQAIGAAALRIEALSAMKETQTQRPFILENNKTYAKPICPQYIFSP